jgi:hypothetical protein
MSVDKKVEAGKLRLVLPKGLGHAVITQDFPPALLNETLSKAGDGVSVSWRRAASDASSRGRKHPRPLRYRSEYQRDRDRIALRRSGALVQDPGIR